MAENEKPGVLRNLRVKRVSLVEMGANFDRATGDGAHIMLFKSHTAKDGPGLGSVHVDTPECKCVDCGCIDDYERTDEVGKALDAKARHALPDSAFAAVWTDANGHKQRKLPIHDAGHLAAARGRVDGANIPDHAKAEARAKIDAATHSHSTNKQENNVAKVKTLKEVLKMFALAAAETDPTKRVAMMKEAEAASDAMPEAPPPNEHPHTPDELTAMKGHHDALGKMIKSFGAGPHPPEHPVHAMKAAQDKIGATLKAAGVDCTTDEPGGLDHPSPAVAKQFTALEKRNTELQEQLDIEKNVRLDGEMRTILKGFAATPFNTDMADPENDVVRFRKMKIADPKGFDRWMSITKATDAQLSKSRLFGDHIGSSRSGGSEHSAWARIEALADKLVEKASDGLTFEKAIERVCLDPRNREVVKQYYAEEEGVAVN